MVQEVPISVFPFSPHAEQQARVFTHKGKKGCTRGLLKDRGSKNMWMWLERQLHFRLFSNTFSWKDTSSDLGAWQTSYWQPQQDVKTNTQIRQGKERDSHSLSFKRSHICMENVMPKWVNNSMQWIKMREIQVKLLYERSGVEVEKYQKLFTEILKGYWNSWWYPGIG